jgi:hypothetical protein
VPNASTTQEEESQVMQEEHNALNDDIDVEHILPPQDSNYKVPTDLREDDIFISQTKYAKELVKKFGLDDYKTNKTPMEIDANLGVDEGERSTDIHQYRAMIGSLLYLTASRPVIIFSVCLCARYQANPKESYLIVLK